jgi:hypothetical protein
MPVGEQIRRIVTMAELLADDESLVGGLYYLSDWG